MLALLDITIHIHATNHMFPYVFERNLYNPRICEIHRMHANTSNIACEHDSQCLSCTNHKNNPEYLLALETLQDYDECYCRYSRPALCRVHNDHLRILL